LFVQAKRVLVEVGTVAVGILFFVALLLLVL
jgi:hypothetical protein